MAYKIFTKKGIAYGVDEEGNTFHLPVQYLNEALQDGGQVLADNTVRQWTKINRDKANLPSKNNLWKKEAVEESGYAIQTYKNAMCREGLSGETKPEDKTIVAPKRPQDCTMTAEQWKEYQDYLEWEKKVTDLNKETPFGYQASSKVQTGFYHACGESSYSNTEEDWWMQFYTMKQTGWTASAPNCGDSSPTYEYEFNQEKWDAYTKGWSAMEKERMTKIVSCRETIDRVRAGGKHLWCNEGDPNHLKYYPNDCVMLTPRKKTDCKETTYNVPKNNQDWSNVEQSFGSGYNGITNSKDLVEYCGSADIT